MACYSPLKGYRSPTGAWQSRKGNSVGKMELKCGQCMGCRLDKSKEWAARITHEAQMHDYNCFVTLTYSDDYLPVDESLDKKHFQKFIRKLRKKTGKKIRYYHAGEYGSNTERPHYHAILFGFIPDDLVEWKYDRNTGNQLFTSEMLEDIWGKGFCSVGPVNFTTAAYVARYITKKVTGPQAESHYEWVTRYGEVVQRQPEYATMSLKPGIGQTWLEKYKDDLKNDDLPVPGKGVMKKIPRFYLDRLSEEEQQKIKEAREGYAMRHRDDQTPERLESRFRVKKAQTQTLKRGL